MIRECPKCRDTLEQDLETSPGLEKPDVLEQGRLLRRAKLGRKMRVLACWTRQDGIIGRSLQCPNCDFRQRSYEVLAQRDQRLRTVVITNNNQLDLVWT